MRVSSTLTAALVVLVLGSPQTRGQPAQSEAENRFFRQQRVLDEQLRQERARQAPLESIFDWQVGGWLDYYMFEYGDGFQKSRFVQRPGLTVWTRITADGGAHEFFGRMRLQYTHFRAGDEIDRQEDWWGPDFEQAWYQIDVGKAFRLTQPSDPVQLKARIGRQTVVFGTGFALDQPMEAVLLDGKIHDFRIQGLFGKSILNYPNAIDRSRAVQSHSDRLFYGVQLAYEGWQQHVPFIYALWNNDRTDERPRDLYQNYSYDSAYLGAGAKGSIVHNLNYWVEVVYETGHSYGDGDILDRDYIESFGWDVGIEKLFDAPMRPRLVGEYMFGSGDGNRLYSPTSARGGNYGDRKDSSFAGFGLRDTGIALSPIVSNLHIWKLGGSLAPLEKIELFRNFELGTNWFLYAKNQARGAISDPLADQYSGYVGAEMDYFINWRLSSDLSWTIRWGTFFPGAAYSEQDTRHFIFTGLTWSF